MSMLAIVSFDLHKAKPRHYGQVKRKLAKMSLKKQIHSKKKKFPTKLPANTFAAKFKGKWDKKSASELCVHLKDEVREAISSLGLNATLFVTVGSKWSWCRSQIDKHK